MIPFLTYPLALIALVSLPALAAIYILRNRYRRRQVSSLVLWGFQIQSKAGGAKVHRLQLPLIFFLELLALALLVTAAAGPHWQLPQSARPLIVVLDDSFSMRAIRNSESAQSCARDFLQQLFRSQPPPYTRLILAGKETRLLGASVRSWSEVSKLLSQWHCQAPGAAIDSAITLASELGKQQANILVLTDHKPAEEKITSPRLVWQAFGWSLDNLAFVNASRTAFGDEDRCLLEIANFSPAEQDVRLVIQAGTNTVRNQLLSLGAHQNQRLVFNIPSTTPLLRALLVPPGSGSAAQRAALDTKSLNEERQKTAVVQSTDALIMDNEVRLLPPIRKKVRVQVALADSNLNELANRTLDATGMRAALSQDPELIIHETDANAGSNAWSLRWVSSTNATAYVGPFVVDNSHPLAEDVALQGVVWAATEMTNSLGQVPVILAGNTPLLSVREDVLGRRHLTLNFNPTLSTLQDTPAWPILFWNLLQWRAAELPGLKESNVRLGAEEDLKTTGEAVTVILPDVTKRTFSKTGGHLALETPMPGLYSVVRGTVTNHFVVNPLAAEESDLSNCANGHWGAWGEDGERRFEESSLTWVFGLLALGLLTAHLYLVTFGKGGK